MNTLNVTGKPQQAAVWNFLQAHTHASLWQSEDWSNYKHALGDTCKLYATFNGDTVLAASLVVISTTTGGFSTWELPRGPLWVTQESCIALLTTIIQEAAKEGCIQLYISPLVALPTNMPLQLQTSDRFVQPTATQLINIAVEPQNILEQMKPKGRYNIRVAEKKGIQIKPSNDAEAFARLHTTTGSRNTFTTPQKATYEHFLQLPGSFMLFAYSPDAKEPIAGLIGITHNQQGIYYYGASLHEYRNLMAPYALQWHAMQHCKAAGCTEYDLFGIAPTESTNHPWAGVTSFKQKFGGTYKEYPPEQTIVLKAVLKLLLRIKRKIW